MSNRISRTYPARVSDNLTCLPVSIMGEQELREQIERMRGEWSLAIVKEETNRSYEQNRYWWGVVVPLIADAIGERDKEEAHRKIMAEYYQAQGGIKNPDAKIQSSTMSTVEFMGLIEWVKQWGAEFFSIYIPSPNETLSK